jgi:Pyruvate/2-oxoacid:ferredoxin oxidoreductase delta subunit
MIREIVKIDEDKCDGCGLCVPACHEGAIRIVDGKARLVSDRLCDGLGACLGHCPQGAITIERRQADEFEQAPAHQTAADLSPRGASPAKAAHAPSLGFSGCPGARVMQFGRPGLSCPGRGNGSGCASAVASGGHPGNRPAMGESPAPGETPESVAACVGEPPEMPAGAARLDASSELTHWPVQINLLPPQAPLLRGARLLVAADCVPVAYGGFHRRLLRGRVVLIGCPKFDDVSGYVERLAAAIRLNELREIVVARMEVPCCTGIVRAVLEARRRARVAVPITEVVIGTRGELLAERELAREPFA